MKRTMFVVNPNGPVLPPGSAPGTLRTLDLGGRYWELATPPSDWGGEWTWKRTSLFQRTWSLASENGTHLVLCEASMFSRLWRAEASTGGWTLKRSWVSRTVVAADDGTIVLTYDPGAWGRGPIVPASGPELKFRWNWPGGFKLEDREGYALLQLARAPGFFNPDHRLTLSDVVRKRDDLLPLLALTWLLALAARHARAH